MNRAYDVLQEDFDDMVENYIQQSLYVVPVPDHCLSFYLEDTEVKP